MSDYDDIARPALGPLFEEPIDRAWVVHAMSDDGFEAYRIQNWYRIWASQPNWEASAHQLGRMYREWSSTERPPLHRLFWWLAQVGAEYSNEEAEPMLRLLVDVVGWVPPDPDPDAEYARFFAEAGFPPKQGRRPISKSLRFRVFSRDHFTCQYCGRSAPTVILHCDHIKPVSAGGTGDLLNLVTACLDCNIGKGALDDVAVRLAALRARSEKE